MAHPDFVITSKENEDALREAVKDPAKRAEVQARLDQLVGLQRERRVCHVSDTQRKFLQRVLGFSET